MTKIKSLTIAIPLYNEEKSILNLHDRLTKSLKTIKLDIVKVLLVDDGSIDDTNKLLNKFFDKKETFQIINHPKNLNLNGFLETAIQLCETEYIVFLDADCTFDPMLISDMIDLFSNDVEIINGSPYHPMGKINGVNKWRLLISKTANYIYKRLLKQDIYTFTSIFKMYKTSLIKNITLESEGFASVAELFVKSIIRGGKVVEFPCELSIRQYGYSKIKIIDSSIQHLKLMLKILVLKLNMGN